ncbi:aminotransferase family protein (LolT) [Marssonina coronariae]|uniref:Aminotransferase family protein (LolT) n=1 Tax=Diplocarpon coronariae TaxID=2795749 RepID=A0A218YYX5_9HELO|nr:aminotransferase family protein (LolT) [Marssonina coronariae]
MTITRHPAFGHPMREEHFQFASTYKPINHGSFGTHPLPVRSAHSALQSQAIARPDTFVSYTTFPLLARSRVQLAPLLGVHHDEIALIPNATTGVNTVLRNLAWQSGDVVLAFSTIYAACEKTLASIGELTPLRLEKVDITYPLEDAEIVRAFVARLRAVRAAGKRVRLAMFDTVLTFPGARFPWEELVRICREEGVWSLVDGAHGIGHIDLAHVGETSPDFFVSNCHKWLYTPRSCAVFHVRRDPFVIVIAPKKVPFRNQHLIHTSLPTSHGYQHADAPPEDTSGRTRFIYLFDFVATIDYTPYMCIPAALDFRRSVCGGETRIREYCFDVARRGGDAMAAILGTSVMTTPTQTMRQCAFANVELPVTLSSGQDEPGDLPIEEAGAVAAWLRETAVREMDTYLQTAVHGGKLWVRLSGQIYLEVGDFEWVAHRLGPLCRTATNKTSTSPSPPSSPDLLAADDPAHKQDWSTTTPETDSWAVRERRRSSMWSRAEMPELAPDPKSKAGSRRRGSVLSVWRGGKDSRGRDVLVHDGSSGDDEVGSPDADEEAVRSEDGKAEAVGEPGRRGSKSSRGRDRRGSILSLWSNGKDAKGRDVVIHDDEEWKV